MKGIILAGGTGSRLHPITLVSSKQLMPVYDKPMIYYPLSILMMADIRDILIITTYEDVDRFKKLLGDGSQLGCKFTYRTQASPNGIAEAFLIAEDWINNSPVALILGDNIFHGTDLVEKLQAAKDRVTYGSKGAVVFAYHVNDPERYGVVEFNDFNLAISIEEKPEKPKSNYAIPGIYFYDNRVVKHTKTLKPSPRGELEITDLNNVYLSTASLKVEVLDRGTAWLDTGTFESLQQASQYVQVIEDRQGLKIGCIEEVAYRRKFIKLEQLHALAEPLIKSGYGKYLKNIR